MSFLIKTSLEKLYSHKINNRNVLRCKKRDFIVQTNDKKNTPININIIDRIRVIEIALGRLAIIGSSSGIYGKYFDSTHQTLINQFEKEPINISILMLSIFCISVYPAILEGCSTEEQVEEKVIGRISMILLSSILYGEFISAEF
jgi:hypothetical protein